MPEKSVKALKVIGIADLIVSIILAIMVIVGAAVADSSSAVLLIALYIIIQGVFVYAVTACLAFVTEKVHEMSYKLNEKLDKSDE